MKHVTSLLLNGLVALRDVLMSGFITPDQTAELSSSTTEKRMSTDRRRLLKIKLKSLAAEAVIIRNEELKARYSKRPEVQELREEMHKHRVKDLREESRATLLAYSFIRGKKYRDIEGRSDWGDTDPYVMQQWASRMDKVRAMVNKYGGMPNGTHDVAMWLALEPSRPLPPMKPKQPYTGPKGPQVVTVQLPVEETTTGG